MFETIQGRILSVFVGFIVLLAGGVAASYFVLEQQADDGLIVNLAGRQRMLTQKMTKESAQLANAASAQQAAKVSTERDRLTHTMRVFETSLLALKDGGPAPVNLEMTRMRDTPAAATPKIKQQLEVVATLWAPFKKHLQRVISSNGTDTTAVGAVARDNMQLLKEMNAAVSLMQNDSERKVSILYMVQSLALGLGLVLVGLGAWVARSSIARPIVELSKAATSMSTGDLNVRFDASGTREVRELGASFDRMRASMMAAFGSAGGGSMADDDI